MKIYADKLPGHVARELAAVYLISGDEHLLVAEAADVVRTGARAAGCTERELLFPGRGFDWSRFRSGGANLSLFAQRRLVELRLASAAPGKEGGAALVEYARRPPEDDVLLVICPKLDKKTAPAAWVKAFTKAGVFVQVWPMDAERLPGWVNRRMRKAGLEPTRAAVTLLADRIEGNLLAASQEIEKLALLNGPGHIDDTAVQRAVADSARFDVFQLADAAVTGDRPRALRILDGLQSEGVEPPLVLWALTRELGILAKYLLRVQAGETVAAVVAGLWDRRRDHTEKALQNLGSLRAVHRLLLRAARADGAIKGREPVLPWEALAGLVADVAGAHAV